ncbi:hypothetical protein IG195_04515 [Arthrobacter sp. TES]|uniref:hypothetical protein n=1 Tax=Paenarthrobacter ureafaciens TaxID=37931 RepID=UPI000395F063|nr:hypothetical protein [Paenarthrobacter ureafaciens]AOY72723.1 hypothetical protein ARZXY2_3208 [Arthrobacter sp. ZXY-2]ERI38317.1 hypothetical protein M707_06095 [Arthrobacter sp. AK-YN10]QOI64352.1 hypothetical protein IG195_04515 [Arthrobacter sp. TES]QQQ62925.1 hypothetical protein JHQ56_03460 [Paenarthrobacter ureafaciens]GLU58938.1 hypothetical protein Pure01_14510 [Paenarthrobacter ureafaciens]
MPDFDLPPVYEVDPEYLLREDGKLPRTFEAELELVSTLRLNGILNFAAPILGAVDPEGCKVIANAIAKHADEVN